MPYKPAHVANSFLWQAKQEGVGDVDQLKIQKLVYCLHGWFLATRNNPAVGELFEAWPYGPVLSSLYREFRNNGASPIEGYAVDLDPENGGPKIFMVNPEDRFFYDVFDLVWNRYKFKNGLQLSALTHAPGTPWSISRSRGDNYIPNDLIRHHFFEIASKD